jgi:hypothetical protein
MFSPDTSPLHVFIDQQEVIDKAEHNHYNKTNSKIFSTKKKITIGITTSSVICFVSDFLVCDKNQT